MQTNKTNCPECGKEIDLVPSLTDIDMLLAYCDCNGRGQRPVVQVHYTNLADIALNKTSSAQAAPVVWKKKDKGGSHA